MQTPYCALCHNDDLNALEDHHVIPRILARVHGLTDNEGILTFCGRCHGVFHGYLRPMYLGALIREGQIASNQRPITEKKAEALHKLQHIQNEIQRLLIEEEQLLAELPQIDEIKQPQVETPQVETPQTEILDNNIESLILLLSSIEQLPVKSPQINPQLETAIELLNESPILSAFCQYIVNHYYVGPSMTASQLHCAILPYLSKQRRRQERRREKRDRDQYNKRMRIHGHT